MFVIDGAALSLLPKFVQLNIEAIKIFPDNKPIPIGICVGHTRRATVLPFWVGFVHHTSTGTYQPDALDIALANLIFNPAVCESPHPVCALLNLCCQENRVRAGAAPPYDSAQREARDEAQGERGAVHPHTFP